MSDAGAGRRWPCLAAVVAAAACGCLLAFAAPGAAAARLAFSCGLNLCGARADGSGVHRLLRGDRPVLTSFPSVSRDGRRLVWMEGQYMWSADRGGAGPRLLSSGAAPYLRPDGRTLVYEDWPQVCIARFEPPNATCGYAWSAHLMGLASRGRAFVKDWDGPLCLTDPRHVCRRVVVEQRQTGPRLVGTRVSPSPDGRLLAVTRRYTSRDDTRIDVLRVATGRLVRHLSDGRHVDDWPAWSPDGRYVAFQRGLFTSAQETQPDVMVVRARGGRARRIATGLHPTWSR